MCVVVPQGDCLPFVVAVAVELAGLAGSAGLALPGGFDVRIGRRSTVYTKKKW